MELDFDFRFHSDPSSLVGTQYFELYPGRHTGEHWVPGGRFIHEVTFCLFEGIFEKGLPNYDHLSFIEVFRPQWKRILLDLAALLVSLEHADESSVSLPYGQLLNVREAFEQDLANNQRALASLISEFQDWLRQTLTVHDCISVMGL